MQSKTSWLLIQHTTTKLLRVLFWYVMSKQKSATDNRQKLAGQGVVI